MRPAVGDKAASGAASGAAIGPDTLVVDAIESMRLPTSSLFY
ncbi:hypothetical protein ACFVXC_09540 [Streptomyces sp. NPDC058257]